MNLKIFKSLVTIFIMFIFLSSCAKDSATTNNLDNNDSILTSTSVINAIPTDLAVSSTTEKITTATFLLLVRADPPGTPPPGNNAQPGRDFRSKVDLISNVLAITDISKIGDCAGAINLNPQGPPSPNCYGPPIYYSKNHPDNLDPSNTTGSTLQCGNGQDVSNTDPYNGSVDCFYPSGDVGIWKPTFDGVNGGESCAAAKLNNVVYEAGKNIDLAVGLEAMIICAAKVNGKGLPANGSQLNVTSFAQSALAASGKAITITSAQITRESADTSNGNAVYLSNISGSYTNANNQAASFSLSFKHIPQNEDNTKYAGLLTYITNANANDPNMANMKDVVSVLYGKNGSSLSYRMRLATFCQSTDTSVYFNAQGEVTEISNSTFGDQTSCTGVAKNGWTGGFNESIAQIDITTGVGKLAFGWQAGQGDGFLRTMNVETRADGSGDAFFGFTRNEKNADNTSSLRAEGDLLIDGMICNWSGPFGNHNPDVNSLVQMQVLTKNAQGVWIPTSSMINFAPTNSCSALQGSDTQPFKFGVDKAEYDSRMGPFTNNLATIATHYNFSMPAVPSLPK